MDLKKLSLATKAIHGRNLHAYRGPVSLPIYQTSTYRLKNSGDAIRYAKGDPSVYVYGRYHNPTVTDVEEKIAFIDDGEAAALFASGMAAISTAVLTFVHAGEEMVSTPSLYGGAYRFFRDTLPSNGISVKYTGANNLGDLQKIITPKTRLVHCETPTNPTLDVVDLERLVHEVKKAEKRLRTRIITMVDNTFASCVNQKPFDFGVDIVMESATKYLGGHSDILAGVVVGAKKHISAVKTSAKYYGGCADPFMAYLLFRSLKTFELRVQRQNENAMTLASRLERHPKILSVLYPGLKSHPKHALAKKQMTGFGGMVTIEVKGGAKAAVKVCDSLRIALNAMSLGGAETLVSIPIYSSHVNMKDEELKRHGVRPGMIRISVGVEGIEDLIADFEQALKKI
jgi:methionine-gamma-lyase